MGMSWVEILAAILPPYMVHASLGICGRVTTINKGRHVEFMILSLSIATACWLNNDNLLRA